MRKTILLPLLMAVCCAPETDYTVFVDPHIGTGGHGHVFMGANVPFGMVQLGPTSIPQSWDWCSGYHAGDSTIIGFSHTHLSGTGIGDLFDVTVMPVTGDVVYARGTEDDPWSGLWSYGDLSREIARPGYYSIPLLRYGITAELTATSRVGFHRYTFPASEDAALVFDLENGGCWDKVTDSHIEVTDSVSIRGWRFSSGWAKDQKQYFYAVFSKPFRHIEDTPAHYARFGFHTTEGEQVLLKVALSPVSMEGAEKAMQAELPGWDFEAVQLAALNVWNRELGKIAISTDDPVQKTVFYTALYHTMVAPSLFSDVDADETEYTTFSLWDTYRAAMPLATLIHQERMDDFTRTFYRIYQRQGDLPVWHLMGNETDCMIGNPGLIVFADNIVKGFTGGLDKDMLLNAMTATADRPDRGQDLRMQYGFIPSDLYNWSVATDLEYAIADAALAEAASFLGADSIAVHYRARSQSWRHFWDPETHFLRGLKTDGTFSGPFNPCESDHFESDYVEGTPWQYLWLVPHDTDGLCSLFGSREAMLGKLDSLFTASSVVEGDNASMDISGLVGQYAHGNEPGHHTIYLYSMLGEHDKAADLLRKVRREMYTDRPDGLAGNEDVGQMSAWYILTTLGFYQTEPARPRFWFGVPAFRKAVVRVGGNTFTILAKGLQDNSYIREVRLNGKPYDLPYITYEDITKGGVLEFRMGL